MRQLENEGETQNVELIELRDGLEVFSPFQVPILEPLYNDWAVTP